MGLDAASIGSSVDRARGPDSACRPASSTDPRAVSGTACAASRDRAAGADRGGGRARRPGSSAIRQAFAALRPRRARANGCAAHPQACVRAAEPAVLDRRGAVFDGDGAARRGLPAGPLSHRRRRHQRTALLAQAGAASTGRTRFAASDLGFRDRHFDADARTAIASDGRGAPAGALSAGQPVRPPILCRARSSTTSSSAATC